MKIWRSVRMLGVVLAALVVVPAWAAACVFVPPGPIATRVPRADVRPLRPASVPAARASWKLAPVWQSQFVAPQQTIIDTRGRHTRVFHSRQDTLRLTTTWRGGGVTYEQDPSSGTTCVLDGHRRWSAPIVRVRETRTAVLVVAASRRISGSTAGCMMSVIDCTVVNVTRTLARPIGARRVVYQSFTS